MISLDSKIEAILFFLGEPQTIKRLSLLTNSNVSDVTEALLSVERRLETSGLCLVRKENEVMLGTKPELSDVIERITKEELTRSLGRAGLETLSIILYKSPVTKKEIDFIRGVNSGFIIRNLLIRGLIERTESKTKVRGYSYSPTLELISFMGLKNIGDLPEHDEVLKELEQFGKKEDEIIDQDKTE